MMFIKSRSSKSGPSFMRRLKISHALVAVVMLPLLMALALSGMFIFERQQVVRDASSITIMAEPLFLLSDLVYDLQKERGKTAVFLTSGSDRFRAEMQAQRAETDRKQANLDSFFATHDFASANAGWVARLENIRTAFSKRQNIRQRIDQQRMNKADAFSYYTEANMQVIDLVKFTGHLSHDVSIANTLIGFAYFLMGNEHVGIERAVGASGFAVGHFTIENQQTLQNLMAIQRIYFSEFGDMAGGDMAKIVSEIMQSPVAKEVQAMRDVAMADGAGTLSGAGDMRAQSVSSYSANDFFDAQTKKITLLEDGETRIAAQIQNLISQKEARAKRERNMLVAGMALLLCFIVGFIVMATRAISCCVVAVVHTAESMADGNLEAPFPPVFETEIGRIIKALIKFRDSILEARKREAQAKQTEKELLAARLQQEEEARAAEKEREAQALRREQERLEERELSEMEKRAAEKALEATHRKQQEALRAKEQKAAAEIALVVRSYGEGDFSSQVVVDDKEGVFAEICDGLNRIGRFTRQNLEQVQAALTALKNGDIRHRMTGEFSGAFSLIQQDLNEAFESLTAVINQIDSSSEKVRTSTNEIAEASTSLAKRTEAAAANLEETTASVEELSKAVHRTSELAISTNSSIAGIEGQTKKSTEIVKETIDAITGIKEASKSISKTISVIDEIAFQTNLLALNAGVEAARAGDAGRGFAVVASEIRELAAKSSAAAHEISTLMKNNETQVAVGVTLVDQTGAALTQIDTDITEISHSVNEIAEFATQQSGSIDEIKLATNQLDKVTQENAAMFEETTALNVSLKTETEILRNIMANFDLGPQAQPAQEQRVVALHTKMAPRRAESAALRAEAPQDWQDF